MTFNMPERYSISDRRPGPGDPYNVNGSEVHIQASPLLYPLAICADCLIVVKALTSGPFWLRATLDPAVSPISVSCQF